MSYFTTPSHFPLPRSLSTDCSGNPFEVSVISAVWCKGQIDPYNDASIFRKDRCGAWIKYGEYGKSTKYGWHIDHDVPVARGGGDGLENLQPLHWQNNLGKSDNYPWTCTVQAKV